LDASTLRWILIVVGILIVGSIFLFGNPSKRKAPKASRRREAMRKAQAAERREPTLDGEPEAIASMEDMELGGQGELNIGATPEPEVRREPAKQQAPLGPPPDRIVTLFLLARDNHVITGADLLQATVSTGMEFGDMKIFHRVQDGEDKPVFSMANAEKPGHFERDEWNTFETAGVVLFLTLPAPLDALDAWDSMLAAGRRMSEILHAELLDEERSPFTRQREAQIREEMREYDRQNNPSS
jgi:cell division protein ZipA